MSTIEKILLGLITVLALLVLWLLYQTTALLPLTSPF